MIIESKNILTKSNQQTVDFQINNEDGHLFNVLSELYSDPVGSTIREISTNCVDAHIMSKNEDRPFVIKLPNSEKHINEISFRDYGPGLQHNEILDIYRIYGKSTKNKNADVTGCLGLGSKSPYSISSTFYVKSYLNGKVYLYTCAMNNNGKPNITENPIEMDTTEENGLEIIIPIYQKIDYPLVLKKVLKYFKIKPLVYTQMGNLDDDKIVEINWDKIEETFPLTDTIHIDKNLLDQKNYLNDNFKKNNSEVIQLQIYYPLDSEIILNTIDRFNRAFISIDGGMNDKFMISESRKKIIKFLLDTGIKLYSRSGFIAFSPSRESIKYTDYTLEYIIKELNKAAKRIEKVIFKNFKKLTTTYESFYDSMVLNYSSYINYISFCNKLDIDLTEDKEYKKYFDLIYSDDKYMDFIIGKYSKRKETVKDLDFISGISRFTSISHPTIRELHLNFKNEPYTHLDLFNKDILKKHPNLPNSHNVIITAIMSDNFKNTLKSELNDILLSIREDIIRVEIEYFNNVYNLYNDGSLTYQEYLNLLSYLNTNKEIDFNKDRTEVLNKIRENITRSTLKKMEKMDMANFSLNIMNTTITNYDRFDVIRILKYLRNMINLLNVIHTFTNLLFLKDLDFSSQKVNFFYYLGKFLNLYMERKSKIKNFEIYEHNYSKFNIGQMQKHISLLGDDAYNTSTLIKLYLPEMISNSDKFFADFSIQKTKPNVLIYLVIELTKRLVLNHMNVVKEQLSLINYDLTPYVRMDLAKLHLMGADTKHIHKYKDLENKSKTITQRINFSPNPDILTTKQSEFLFIDYTKEQCEEYFEYMKTLLKFYLKTEIINLEFKSILYGFPAIRPRSAKLDLIYPQMLLNNGSGNVVTINGKEYTSLYHKYLPISGTECAIKKDKIKNQKDITGYTSIQNNLNKIKTYYNLLTLDYSVNNYNILLSNVNDFIENYLNIGIPEYDNYFKSLKKFSKKNTLVYGNRLIHSLPKDYDYNDTFINLVLENENETEIDGSEFVKIVNYLKNKKVLIYSSKPTIKLNSKSTLKIDNFSLDKGAINGKTYSLSTSDKQINNVLKDISSEYNKYRFSILCQTYNELHNDNYVIVASDSIFISSLKKNSYNIFQWLFMVYKTYNEKYISSKSDLYIKTENYNINSDYFDTKRAENYPMNFFNEIFKYNHFKSSDKIRISKFINMKNGLEKSENYFAENFPSDLYNFVTVLNRIKLDFNSFMKIYITRIPNELVGEKLLKELKIAYNYDHSQYIKSMKTFFGNKLIDKLINLDLSIFKTDDENRNLNDKLYKLLGKEIRQFNCIIELRNNLNSINKLFHFESLDKTGKKIKKFDIVEQYSKHQLEMLKFIADIYKADNINNISGGLYNKFISYERFNRLLSFHGVNNDLILSKINTLLRKRDSKEEIKKLLNRKLIHEKINTRTHIEKRKNKDKQLKIIPQKKYYPL